MFSKNTSSSSAALVAALSFALGGSALFLSGCSSPKSEMADAINKYLANKPDTSTISVSVNLPRIDSDQSISGNGVLGLALPDAKNLPVAKALADLASAQLIEAKPLAVFPEKNPNSFEADKTIYVKASSDSNDEAILKQLQAASPGTVWSNLSQNNYGFGHQGYIAQSNTFDNSKMGAPDPDFFTALQKNQSSSPEGKILAKLASKGYLRAEEKNVYLKWGAPLVGEWTGDPRKAGFAARVDAVLYFMTDKGKGLVAMRPLYNGQVPAVKLADAKVLKIISVSKPGQNMFGQTITTVNFEETKTLTGINKDADLGLPEPSVNNGEPILSQVKIIKGEIQGYGASNLLSSKPIQAVSYTVPSKGLITASPYEAGVMNVALGHWSLKSVDNYSKDKNPLFGGQVAQCTFQFEFNPKIKPITQQLLALGLTEKDLPKSGETKPYDCVVSAMDKGYSVMGCQPASKSGGL